MPSYTEEQKRRAVDMVEECGGSVTRAMRRLGYPTRQTLYQWLNQRDASHERRSGRPWSHYDPALKAQAVAFVRLGMAGKDVAEMLGVSSAAVVYNWARYPMRSRTWSTAPSGPRRPTSCDSPTSRSSGCRAARCTCLRSSTASTAPCPPGRSARARTRSSPTAASRPYAARSARTSAP